MKKIIPFLSLMLISFSVHADIQFLPKVGTYCSKEGSIMTIKVKENTENTIEIILLKNAYKYKLIAPVVGFTSGGDIDIEEKQNLLKSRNLIASTDRVTSVNLFNHSTLTSSESTMRVFSTISEVTVNSKSLIVILNSNDADIFIGSKSWCQEKTP